MLLSCEVGALGRTKNRLAIPGLGDAAFPTNAPASVLDITACFLIPRVGLDKQFVCNQKLCDYVKN